MDVRDYSGKEALTQLFAQSDGLKGPVAVAEYRHIPTVRSMSVDIEILRTDHKVNVNDGIVDAFWRHSSCVYLS